MNTSALSESRKMANGEESYKLGVIFPGEDDGRDVGMETGYRTVNSEGIPIGVQMLWHLELSPMKHVYVTRYDTKVQLHVRVFTLPKNRQGELIHPMLLRPSRIGVTLNRQQVRDLMYVIWPLHGIVWRNEEIDVS
jgi:hypothetical protein